MNELTDYYTRQKNKLINNHRQLMAIGLPLMQAKCGRRVAKTAVGESEHEFEQLLPYIPYKRQYPADFVFELVPKKAPQAVWEINYGECAIVKFFAQQGAAELTPHMCRFDYLLFPAMGIQLRRNGTIALCSSHCDFRFQAEKQA